MMHKDDADALELGIGGGEARREQYVARMDASVRRGFIQKVYGILCVQLAWVFSVVAALTLSPAARVFVEQTPAVLGVALFAYFASFVLLMCCGEEARRKVPTNYYLLAMFTVATSLLVGVSACAFAPLSVGLASFFTFAIFCFLTAYAHTTKADWTVGSVLPSALIFSLLAFACTSACVPASGFLSAVWGFLGAIMFSAYIVVDTQALLTRLGPDDYVAGALQLFLDLMNLFLELLRLLGQRER